MTSRVQGRCLLVFARDPQPGRVKTRLVPSLGVELATALYRQMLLDTLGIAARTGVEKRELWVDRGNPDAGLVRAARDADMPVRIQSGVDLGMRMHRAFAAALPACRSAVLIGSDCPEYDSHYIENAFAMLERHDAVIGPAADGGYVLIGLNWPQPGLFSNIAWGGDRVLDETRRRLRSLVLDWHELPTLRDIDQPADLAHFPGLMERAALGVHCTDRWAHGD
jgi:rSAM/selenodomain-associated transferase 1